MKRRDLVCHLAKNGCIFFREGGNHAIFVNPNQSLTSSVPRHREINDFWRKKFAETWE